MGCQGQPDRTAYPRYFLYDSTILKISQSGLPYFSGTSTPIIPSLPNSLNMWMGNSCDSSHSMRCGLICCWAKSRAASATWRVISLCEKFIKQSLWAQFRKFTILTIVSFTVPLLPAQRLSASSQDQVRTASIDTIGNQHDLAYIGYRLKGPCCFRYASSALASL